MADDLVAQQGGARVTFAFVYPPERWMLSELEARGYDCCWSLKYVKSGLEKPMWESQFQQVLAAESQIICQLKPDLIINDLRFTVPLSAHELGVPVCSVIRCLVPTPCTEPKARFFSDMGLDIVLLNELFDRGFQLVPHSPGFLQVNTSNPIYFRPCWADRVDPPSLAQRVDDKPIVCVLTTAYPNLGILEMVLAAFKDMKSDAIVCYPHGDYHLCDNDIVCEWADLNSLFFGAKVVVSVGGHGTIMRALMRGVPCIVLDIEEHRLAHYGSAIEAHGVGIFLRHFELSSASLSQAVKAVLSSKTFGQQSVKMQRVLRELPSFGTAIRSLNLTP